MPCRYDSDENCASTIRAELDLTVRLLCKMIAHFDIIKDDKELQNWKAQHDEMDRMREKAESSARIAKEKARQQLSLANAAMAKLTPEELAAIKAAK